MPLSNVSQQVTVKCQSGQIVASEKDKADREIRRRGKELTERREWRFQVQAFVWSATVDVLAPRHAKLHLNSSTAQVKKFVLHLTPGSFQISCCYFTNTNAYDLLTLCTSGFSDPLYRCYVLITVCGDTLCLLNKYKRLQVHVPLCDSQVSPDKNQGSFDSYFSTISLFPNTPSLFLTLHHLVTDCKMLFSIFRWSSILLSPWYLSLYLTTYFPYRWRTDLQKELRFICVVASFWSSWWVTKQPQGNIYKCVFFYKTFFVSDCSVVVTYCTENNNMFFYVFAHIF